MAALSLTCGFLLSLLPLPTRVIAQKGVHLPAQQVWDRLHYSCPQPALIGRPPRPFKTPVTVGLVVRATSRKTMASKEAAAEGLLRRRIRAFEDVIDADQLPFQPGESFLASPTLHIILYVNVLFFIFSWFTEILLLQPRFQEMEQRFRILTQVVVTYFTVTDIIRLYLGTAGNQGKVRLLTLFLGLTVVMMASCLLLVHSHLAAQFTPVESNLFLSAVGLQAAEMVFGGLALRTMRRMMA
ncbi:transmembrane protein 17B-like isoform X2 [Narcine bancroftii]|uniref:transmembrane protein 17B-like isoform X2 n=1 Tax=Narcine bancroftii TaxID=1343680 RepID=UPI003831C597